MRSSLRLHFVRARARQPRRSDRRSEPDLAEPWERLDSGVRAGRSAGLGLPQRRVRALAGPLSGWNGGGRITLLHDVNGLAVPSSRESQRRRGGDDLPQRRSRCGGEYPGLPRPLRAIGRSEPEAKCRSRVLFASSITVLCRWARSPGVPGRRESFGGHRFPRQFLQATARTHRLECLINRSQRLRDALRERSGDARGPGPACGAPRDGRGTPVARLRGDRARKQSQRVQ